MKKILLICLVLISVNAYAQPSSQGWISVSGNQFVDQNQKPVIFRGLNFADPDKLEKDGRWDKRHFEEAKNWGANIIRLPVHPRAWRSRGKENYLKLLDQAVSWAKEVDIYLIIDWHSIGNLRTGLYQHEMYQTDLQETFDFWYTIARKYKDEPVVAMYEMFNEPNVNLRLGAVFKFNKTAGRKGIITDIIEVMHANNPRAIPLVAGFNWAYDLTPLMYDPLDIPGIAYVSHPYPQKRTQPWEPQWERDFGFVAEKAPVILTEMGFALPDEKGAHVPVKGDEEYGRRIVDYAKSKGISWVVWVFDPDWSPMMIKDWNYTPTRQGTFFKKVLQEGN